MTSNDAWGLRAELAVSLASLDTRSADQAAFVATPERRLPSAHGSTSVNRTLDLLYQELNPLLASLQTHKAILRQVDISNGMHHIVA
jgi:hypothetical protein